MMLHRGIREVEFHIKVNEPRPNFTFTPQVPSMNQSQQQPQPQQPQQQPNYYRVDLRNERVQDESMVSRNQF